MSSIYVASLCYSNLVHLTMSCDTAHSFPLTMLTLKTLLVMTFSTPQLVIMATVIRKTRKTGKQGLSYDVITPAFYPFVTASRRNSIILCLMNERYLSTK